MKSAPFAISRGNRMSEAEYLPRLLLNSEKSKKGGTLFKKSGEVVSGIAELAILTLVSFMDGEADDARIERKCAKCNNELQEGWFMCPFCGIKLGVKCPQCRETIQPEWMACLFCGKKLK